MKSIVTLGPKETFSDIAAQNFSKDSNFSISYEKTIRNVFKAVTKSDSFGVVPIENLTEGFVQPTLDALIEFDLKIVGELLLSVQFSFVSNVSDRSLIEKLFVHPVASGQCSEFITSLINSETVYTNSNIDSLNRLEQCNTPAGAVIPQHVFKDSFPHSTENVSNYSHNQTRFFLISPKDSTPTVSENVKCSLLIKDDSDHSGILSTIVSSFATRDINLNSIVSIPTKEAMGKYHFFIEIAGAKDSKNVVDAISEISKYYPVKILGDFESSY
jgi:prephenate dehydratase